MIVSGARAFGPLELTLFENLLEPFVARLIESPFGRVAITL
jgi:hypothetical protein